MAAIAPIYLGIGNPLLDITVPSTLEYLKKYNLKEGDAVIATEQQLSIYPECLSNPSVKYSAGGSSMNTARAVQWMLHDKPGSTAFIGCTGTDESGRTLATAVKGAGVIPLFLLDNTVDTGRCAVLVTEKDRTLVTALGAAEHYKKAAHLDVCPDVQRALASAKVYYSEGFFTSVSAESLIALGQRALAEGKTFMFNISATFLVLYYWDKMSEILEYVDYVFCNETEAGAVATKMGWPKDDLCVVAQKMAALPKKNAQRPRTVVITHGSEPTTMCRAGEEPKTFPSIKCPKEKIADTNGCGDSFVGGFISQFLQGADTETCIKAGHYCAWRCLQEQGCTYVGVPEFKP